MFLLTQKGAESEAMMGFQVRNFLDSRDLNFRWTMLNFMGVSNKTSEDCK